MLFSSTEETPFIVRNDDDTGSTTDRHGNIVFKKSN